MNGMSLFACILIILRIKTKLMNIYFGLFFLCAMGFTYAEELVCKKNNWRIEDRYNNNDSYPGWILQASKENVTKELYFHCRRIEILKETNNFLIIKDIGITHSSTLIFVVYFGQQQPYVIYTSPDVDIPTETDVDVLLADETDTSLVLHIKIFKKRHPEMFLIIKNTINISGGQ